MKRLLYIAAAVLLVLTALPSISEAGCRRARRSNAPAVNAGGPCSSQVQGRVFFAKLFHRR